jgi:hypothetical protein
MGLDRMCDSGDNRLLTEGAPIHGVGIQGHWSLNTRVPDVEKAIENYAALGLKLCIS